MASQLHPCPMIKNTITPNNLEKGRKGLFELTVPGCSPSLQESHRGRRSRQLATAHPYPWVNRYEYICTITPMKGVTHFHAGSSHINQGNHDSPGHPQTCSWGQPDLDSPSLRFESQVILGCVPLTIRINHYTGDLLYQFSSSTFNISSKEGHLFHIYLLNLSTAWCNMGLLFPMDQN